VLSCCSVLHNSTKLCEMVERPILLPASCDAGKKNAFCTPKLSIFSKKDIG
jgi:hypothetical protein